MTDVIAWPPFQLTGWELAEVYPQSRSVGLFDGRPRTSSALRGRRVATANVTGIGTNMDGAGYVRMLNRQWAGSPQLVRVECMSSLWYLARGNTNLVNNVIEWTDDGTDLLWTDSGTELLWFEQSQTGVPNAADGWNNLFVTDLPPNTIVARPSELIRVKSEDGASSEAARVLKTATSGPAGSAIIRTDKATAFTISGPVSIGEKESIVFEALGVPRAVQGVTGTFGFQWDFREVYESEYSDGWTEIDPWG